MGETIINNKYDIDFVEPKIRICPATPILNTYDIKEVTYILAHVEWIKWIKNGKDYGKRKLL